MTDLPRHKYDLLPYSVTLSTPSNYTHHRPSKREYVESSDVEDIPSSPPRKYRSTTRKRREWRDSSDIVYSSDADDDDIRRMFEDTVHILRPTTKTVARDDHVFSSQQTTTSQENSTSKFHRLLNAAIMDGLESVDFSECGLYELPGDIGELKYVVRSAALQHEAPLVPQLKLFLGTGNHLTSLPIELFSLSNLTVLSLWNNKLNFIPAAIGNLVSLRELNLSGNQLSYLPHTLLDLKHLQHLRLHPNPLLAPPESYSPNPTPPSSQIHNPAILRARRCPSRPPDTSFIPSLVELASRALAKNFILADIDKAWDLPEYLRNKALHAEEQYRWHNNCAICETWYVDEPLGVDGLGCIEWYDSLHGNDAVPISRGLCSWACVVTWNSQVEEILFKKETEEKKMNNIIL